MIKDHYSKYKGAWGFKCRYCNHEYSYGAGGCDACRICAKCGEAGGCLNKRLEKETDMRCAACGKGIVLQTAVEGRKTMHHGVQLEIPADVLIPTCTICHEEWWDRKTVEYVDERLDQVLKDTLTE